MSYFQLWNKIKIIVMPHELIGETINDLSVLCKRLSLLKCGGNLSTYKGHHFSLAEAISFYLLGI